MSAFFIIKENMRNQQKVWDVMEHNNRSPSEGLHVASFNSKEMAENYVKTYFNKDDVTRENYYQNLQKQTE
ncbi:MAG: hypothetical protein EBR82_71490 [Caulobacteraceae bacterium]|nr:hypothetical protein [Caulobacteraceae bacterium]